MPVHTPWPEDIGRVARQRRIDLEISQDDLAERVGVTRQWISRFESAKSDASLSKVMNVLRELDLAVDVSPAGKRSGPDALEASELWGPSLPRGWAATPDLFEALNLSLKDARNRPEVVEAGRAALAKIDMSVTVRAAMKKLAESSDRSLVQRDASRPDEEQL